MYALNMDLKSENFAQKIVQWKAKIVKFYKPYSGRLMPSSLNLLTNGPKFFVPVDFLAVEGREQLLSYQKYHNK